MKDAACAITLWWRRHEIYLFRHYSNIGLDGGNIGAHARECIVALVDVHKMCAKTTLTIDWKKTNPTDTKIQ